MALQLPCWDIQQSHKGTPGKQACFLYKHPSASAFLRMFHIAILRWRIAQYNGIITLWIAGGAILSMRRIWPTSSVNACRWWFSCPFWTQKILYALRVGRGLGAKSCMNFRLRSAKNRFTNQIFTEILGTFRLNSAKPQDELMFLEALWFFFVAFFIGAVTLRPFEVRMISVANKWRVIFMWLCHIDCRVLYGVLYQIAVSYFFSVWM